MFSPMTQACAIQLSEFCGKAWLAVVLKEAAYGGFTKKVIRNSEIAYQSYSSSLPFAYHPSTICNYQSIVTYSSIFSLLHLLFLLVTDRIAQEETFMRPDVPVRIHRS